MRISDWSSDVCSSDLIDHEIARRLVRQRGLRDEIRILAGCRREVERVDQIGVRQILQARTRTIFEQAAADGQRQRVDDVKRRFAENSLFCDESSEERRGGNECGSMCRSRWLQHHYKKTNNEHLKKT